jgi:hypothetical protein
VAKKDWVWMGRPAHFICADRCHFRMATYIPASSVIVSTVGDYDPGESASKILGKKRPVDIGFGRKYETFVFKAYAAKDCDCPYHIEPSEIDTLPANDGKTANANHYAMCEKWDRRPTNPRRRKSSTKGVSK